VHHRAGESARNAVHCLDFGHYELAERVDVLASRLDDDVVGTGHIVGALDADDLAYFFCHDGGLADLRLDQDISLDQLSLLTLSGASDTSGSVAVLSQPKGGDEGATVVLDGIEQDTLSLTERAEH